MGVCFRGRAPRKVPGHSQEEYLENLPTRAVQGVGPPRGQAHPAPRVLEQEGVPSWFGICCRLFEGSSVGGVRVCVRVFSATELRRSPLESFPQAYRNRPCWVHGERSELRETLKKVERGGGSVWRMGLLDSEASENRRHGTLGSYRLRRTARARVCSGDSDRKPVCIRRCRSPFKGPKTARISWRKLVGDFLRGRIGVSAPVGGGD